MKANRFRFRVWCKNHKEWEKHDCFLSQDGQLNQFCNGRLLPPMRQDTHIVCMSTDLCDKNGKEIFEGDVIRAELIVDRDIPTMGKVVWSDDYSGWANANDVGETMLYQLATIEVIGNIYENPELLEKEVG